MTMDIYVDPAYAGMILATILGLCEGPSGPRVCGDDPLFLRRCHLLPGWTPRMRG